MRTLALLALFVLAASAAAQDVAVARGPLAADDGLTVSGVVRADAPGPVTLRLFRHAPMGVHSWSSGDTLELKVKDGDRFCIEGLVPGAFQLAVLDARSAIPQFVPLKRDLQVFGDVGGLEVEVPKECSVRCKIALAFDGDVAEAWVEVVALDGGLMRYGRPKDGTVEVTGLAPGRHWATVVYEHGLGSRYFPHGSAAVLVDLVPGANEVAITVRESADVRLRCRSARSGEEVEGVLRCRDLPETQVHEVFRTSVMADGTVRIAGTRSSGYGRKWQEPAPVLALEGLSRGSSTLTVEAPGFAPWERRVEIGEGRTTIDAELTPLPGNYLTLAVSERDTAYADFRPADGGAWRSLLVEDTRDRPSHFNDGLSNRRFLAPGAYFVALTTPEFGPPASTRVELNGDRSTIRLSVERPIGRTLRGTAKSRGGVAVGGFVVHVFLKEGDTWRPLSAKAAVVGKDGAFEIRGLARGTHRLCLDAAGWFPVGDFEVAGADLAREFVVCPRAASGEEHVAAGPLAADEGLVLAGTVIGAGTDPVRLQLARSVSQENGWRGCNWSWRDVTLRPGERFRFTGLPPGEYRLWNDGDGRVTRHVERVDLFADRLGHEFRLPSARLHGRVNVLDPPAGARLSIGVRSENGDDDIPLHVAADGTFDLTSLTPGRWTVSMTLLADGGRWGSHWPERRVVVDVPASGGRFDYDFVPDAPVRLAVRAAGKPESFTGFVHVGEGPDAGGEEFDVRVDGDEPHGVATLVGTPVGRMWGRRGPSAPLHDMPPGTYRVRVTAPGFSDEERAVEVTSEGALIDVAMSPRSGGFVRTDRLGPLYEVFVRPAGAGPWKSLLFADNRVMVTHSSPKRPREFLEPGPYEFIAATGDRAPSEPRTIEIGPERRELDLDLAPVPGRTLRGTLKSRSGVPIGGAELRCFVKDGDGWRRLRTKEPAVDDDGRFEIRGLAKGSYLLAFDDDGRLAAGEFEIAEEDIARVFVFAAR